MPPRPDEEPPAAALHTRLEIIERLGVSAFYYKMMRRAGFEHSHGRRSTWEHVESFFAERPGFVARDYRDQPMRPTRPREAVAA